MALCGKIIYMGYYAASFRFSTLYGGMVMRKIFLVILAFVLIFSLISCSAPAAGEEKPAYEFEDILDSYSWLGKTPDEAGVGEEYIDTISAGITGKLLGEDATGSAYLNTLDADEPVFGEIDIYCSDLDTQVMIDKLTELYGRPYAEGEEPYVESNGGSVMWKSFFTGDGVITVSQGQKNDWFQLECTLNVPDDDSMFAKRISASDIEADTDLVIDMPESGYPDLIVQRLLTDPVTYKFEYTDSNGLERIIWVSQEETDGLPNIVQYDEEWKENFDEDYFDLKWDSEDWIQYDDVRFATVEMMDEGPGLISWFTGDCVYAAAVMAPVTEEDLTAFKDQVEEMIKIER